MTEIWISPDGRAADLVPVECVTGEWFPESPGQRPPRSYELRATASGNVVRTDTVFPVDPWSPYDAISDRLVREGWTPPPSEPDPPCPHGLSSALCAGPGHYPQEM